MLNIIEQTHNNERINWPNSQSRNWNYIIKIILILSVKIYR